ncbi:hypothetical protein HJG60_010320 [Phyllostomus discolor]|uniref:Uncharacterized protein n=1 Tax=Phyllostomus discolor TaxID=89673 RepID=A0A834AZ56_9CHIR|nr:hypothetical protein HJG60_010320 [Phyllostomus discolor]
MWGWGLRGNNGACSALSRTSVPSTASHSRLGPSGAGSWTGGLVYFLRLCGSPQGASCEAGRFSQPQPPQVFSVGAFRVCFPVLGPWVAWPVLLPVFSWFICEQMCDCGQPAALRTSLGLFIAYRAQGLPPVPSAAPVCLGSTNCHLRPAHPSLPATTFSCWDPLTPLYRPPTTPILTGLDEWLSDFHAVHFSLFWLLFCF